MNLTTLKKIGFTTLKGKNNHKNWQYEILVLSNGEDLNINIQTSPFLESMTVPWIVKIKNEIK